MLNTIFPMLRQYGRMAAAALLVSCATAAPVEKEHDSAPQQMTEKHAPADADVTSQVAVEVSTRSSPASRAQATPTASASEAAVQPDMVRAESTGHASLTPIAYLDPNLKCYEILTHAETDDSAPYQAEAGERLISFTFDAPWTETVYVRSIAPITESSDNALRAWLLFREGTHLPAAGPMLAVLPDRRQATLLHAWTAGAGAIYLDPDLGMELAADVSYTLEAHIAVEDNMPGTHRSGAKLCVTTAKPEHLVELAWVGTEAIAGTSANGSCTPGNAKPMHLIAALPRMLATGEHMSVVIDGDGAGKTSAHDADFIFGKQDYALLDAVVPPGGRIDTTCRYSTQAMGGVSIAHEQCQFYALYWSDGPAPATHSLLGKNACLD